MTLNLVILNNKEKLLKYKNIIIGGMAIITALLGVFIAITVKAKSSNKVNLQEASAPAYEEDWKEENVLVVAIDDKHKEEEEARAREIEEEKNAKGIIYLTFDDGPSLNTTPKILEILEKYDIKATFFVLNYDEKKEDIIRKEAELGNTIALHGFSHSYEEVYRSADTCIENFKKIQQKVYETTGKKSNIIRFPGGSSNTISRKYCEGVMTELSTRVLDEGFRYFDWNVDSDDAGSAKSSDDVYNNVTKGIKENRNNIVLMHDFGGNDKTVNALEAIINYGLENGFVFRKITDDTPMCKHSINN